MSQKSDLKTRITVVADVPLRVYAKVAAQIRTSTRGNGVVEPIDY